VWDGIIGMKSTVSPFIIESNGGLGRRGGVYSYSRHRNGSQIGPGAAGRWRAPVAAALTAQIFLREDHRALLGEKRLARYGRHEYAC